MRQIGQPTTQVSHLFAFDVKKSGYKQASQMETGTYFTLFFVLSAKENTQKITNIFAVLLS